MSASPPALRTDDQLLGRYRVLTAGPLGIRARDEHTGDDVAVAWGRVVSKPMRGFEHPAVARLLEEGTYQGAAFAIYEWIDGEPIRPHVATPVSTDQALRWGIEVAAALAAMHDAGVVHGGVRLSNWRLKNSADGSRVCLLRGGLVHDWEDGIAADFAPEQVVREGVVGRRTDLYGLGASLFELLAGRPILIGDSEDDLRGRILSERPPLVTDFRADVPLSLSLLLRHLLRKKAGERIATAKEIEDILRKILAGEPWKPPYEPSPSIAPLMAARAPEPEAVREPELRLSIALLFVFVCAAALLLYFKEWREPVVAPYKPPSDTRPVQPSQINSASRAVQQLLEKGKELERAKEKDARKEAPGTETTKPPSKL